MNICGQLLHLWLLCVPLSSTVYVDRFFLSDQKSGLRSRTVQVQKFFRTEECIILDQKIETEPNEIPSSFGPKPKGLKIGQRGNCHGNATEFTIGRKQSRKVLFTLGAGVIFVLVAFFQTSSFDFDNSIFQNQHVDKIT